MRFLLLLLCLMASYSLGNPQAPNIIIILIDDLGWDNPAFMGHPWHETPSLDRLAKRSTLFTQAYAAAPNCKPSRASLLTGLSPVHHGVYTSLPPNNPRLVIQQHFLAPASLFQLRPAATTIAGILKAHGYRTGLVGKWDLGDGPNGPDAFGFDHAVGWFRGGFLGNGFFAPFQLPGLEQAHSDEYLTTRLGEEAVRFIESGDRPFFLMLSHYAVHLPLEAPDDSIAYFRNKPRPGDGYNATYAAMLKEVDNSVARVLATLDAQGLRENTIVIVTSDNGAMAELSLPSALQGGKGSLGEGGIRVPLLWSGPGVVAGTSDQPVSHLDILPTLLQQLGIPVPATDGMDISACLAHSPCHLERALYWHFPAYISDARFDTGFSSSPAAAIRDGQWKLVEDFEQNRVFLYDIASDLTEQRDLSAQYPEVTARLLKRLHDWQAETNAAMPAVNSQYNALTGWPRWKDALQRRWDQWRIRVLIWLMLQETR